MKKKLRVAISHPDPKIEKQGVRAFLGLVKAIGQLTGEKIEVKIVRCYDPTTRDTKIELYRSEPVLIDSQLEITNAVTDLIEE